MHLTTFLTAAFSNAVFAASGIHPLHLTSSIIPFPPQLTTTYTVPPTPSNDLPSILEALRANNPVDAEAAACAMKISCDAVKTI